MRGVFDDEELEPAEQRRDTELTLGSGTLPVIFLGLVLLSGLCFGLGYTVGHRGAKSAAAAAPAAATAPGSRSRCRRAGSDPKPSAIAQDVVRRPPRLRWIGCNASSAASGRGHDAAKYGAKYGRPCAGDFI